LAVVRALPPMPQLPLLTSSRITIPQFELGAGI
jgi:hypothetical protein